jgi:hypothetical protein
MPWQRRDTVGTGPRGKLVPRRAPPAALGPSGHGVVGAVPTEKTVRTARVTATVQAWQAELAQASFPPPES